MAERWTAKKVWRWAFIQAIAYEEGFLACLDHADPEFEATRGRIRALKRVGKQFLGPEFQRTALDAMLEKGRFMTVQEIWAERNRDG